jgi:hypothetical protein
MKIVLKCGERARCAYNETVSGPPKEIPVRSGTIFRTDLILTMTNSQEDKDKLLKIIRDKRRGIAVYMEEIEPRGSRLTNSSIVFCGIATLLTGAQLAFGKDLA